VPEWAGKKAVSPTLLAGYSSNTLTLIMNYLLTGATGYIGKHLLAELLRSGHRCHVIARQKQGQNRARVLQALAPFALTEQQLSERQLTVLSGDITQKQCDLCAEDLSALAAVKLDGFLHCAGLTRFEQHLATTIDATNITGTCNAYALARQLKITHFHHISTAYVAGDYGKAFSAADLDVKQGFNNPYEASKFAAEKFLHGQAVHDDGFIHIYRPSIVVGGHAVGENNTVSTLYVFLKALYFIRECCRRDFDNGRKKFAALGASAEADGFFIPLRVAASVSATINLVSVHIVTDRVLDSLQEPVQQALTTTALIGTDFTLTQVRDAFSKALSITGVQLVDECVFQEQKRNIFEQKFFRSTHVYLPYMRHAPLFADAGLSPHPKNKRRYKVTPKFIADEFLKVLDRQQVKTAKGALNTLALDVLGVKDAHDYFARFINQELGESFLHRIPYVDSKIRFHIVSETPFDEIIHFNHGRVQIVTRDEDNKADCTYVIEQSLFTEIVQGTTDIRQVFFAGKIKIEGNKEIGLKFGFLFGEHYRNIDDRVVDEVVA